MSSKDYHKEIMCKLCGKVMRNDHMKHHNYTKHGSETANNLALDASEGNLEYELQCDNKAYAESVAKGEKYLSY